jgi:filamentous hemagglutinin
MQGGGNAPNNINSTGAYLEGAEGGAGFGRLADRTVNVSDEGLAIAESHLRQFGDIPENQMMIERLRTAAAEGRPVSGADASFYMHEISESTKMRHGLSYDAAHAEALQKYNVSPFSVYHPDVITTINKIEPGSFNQNWLNFWGIEK